MRYGHFDDANKEYVIERPDTPRPWTNYLGSRKYGAIITNNAGGYSFYRACAEGRFLRMRFNSVPLDQPGRYFYLRDRESGDYWSSTWQPVGKPLEQYKSTCRFGMGYAIMTSDYAGIRSETTYFVPQDQEFEYWWLRVTNTGSKARKLSVFSFAEFSTEWNMFNDLLNLQYTAYIGEASLVDGIISASHCSRLPQDTANFANRDQSRWWWMAQVGAPLSGHDLDREAFVGVYNGFHNPKALVAGKCSNSDGFSDNICGALQSDIELQPGESRDILVLLGVGKAGAEGKRTVGEFGTAKRAAEELDKVRQYWHGLLGNLITKTPDGDFDHMVNVWNAYNALITFTWSRACSLVYTGEGRDGYGYRDTVQDLLGAVPMVPEAVGERLELMISGQESTGGARPEIKPWLHKPGQMKLTPPEHQRSDDCLWLFNAVPTYVAETGDIGFYNKVVRYSDKGEATVLGHLKRALEFNLERTGRNGLPCGLAADWNDCLKLGYHGESVFVAFQVRYGLVAYADICQRLQQPQERAWALDELKKLDAKIQKVCWDGGWFIWAIGEDGTVYGSHKSPEGSIYLNTQVWAVMSGAADARQTKLSLDAVKEKLASPYGVALCAPPFKDTPVEVMRAVLFNPGNKENAGIFSHTQSWAVLAEILRGDGDQAFAYYRAFMPSAYNDRAEIREVEPYVHCQSTHSQFSKKFGTSRLPWLSGTATWSYYVATQWVLGIRPELDGLRIDPCIPKTWPGFSAQRTFRGKRVSIEVKNPNGVAKGVASLTINAEKVDGNLIPTDRVKDGAKIVATMG